MVGALDAANLVGALQGEGGFTVFAPTNAAFEALDAIPDGDLLREVLLYHVAPGGFGRAGTYGAAALLEKGSITTAQTSDITIEMKDGKVLLNGTIEVLIADIQASNGIVHVIKDVLIP